MFVKYQDKHGILLNVGDFVKDKEGIYKVIEYNFYDIDVAEYCIESDRSIFPLSQFNTQRINIEVDKLIDFEKVSICSICGHIYTGWGNNAQPINEGRCCDICNNVVVIPHRIFHLKGLNYEKKKGNK